MDRRVKRTKKAIHEALAEIMMVKTFAEISVTELCKTANLSRKSFYAHYDNINDVVDEMFDDVVDETMKLMDKAAQGKNTKEIISAFAALLFTGLEENSFYDNYMNSPNRGWLLLKMQDAFSIVLEKEILKAEGIKHDENAIKTVADYVSAGLIMAIHKKKRNYRNEVNEETAELLARCALVDIALLQ